MLELAAMDESLRPLQQRLFYLEDEAKANEAAQKASEAAAKATRELARAQDASLKTWENSISALVSQGRAIRSFINSLGATGVSMSLSAARGAYMADLAGAQAGDATAYNRITQSAGAYISTAGQTAGSSVEMARIVAGIKSELSALKPVVTLDENIELLKLIEKSTSTTATATENLDLLGIKAIFDLTQVLTLVDNSEGLPAHLKEMIVNQTGNYKLWLEAALKEDTNEQIQRLLIDGASTYAITVSILSGDDTLSDQDKLIVLQTTGTIQKTYDQLLGSEMTDADKLITLMATSTVGKTVNQILGSELTSEDKSIFLQATETVSKTIDQILGSELGATDKALALTTTTTIGKTINQILGSELGATDKLFAIQATETISKTIDQILGSELGATDKLIALQVTDKITGNISATMNSATMDAEDKALALAESHGATVTLIAELDKEDADTKALQDILTGVGATTTVDGTMTWNPNDPLKAIWVAIRDQTTLTAENTGRYALFSASSGETPAWTVYSGSGDVLARAELARYWGVTQEEWIALIAAARPQFHDGGIASGPDSGYEATLHGTELVVSPAASYPATVKGGDNVILLEEVKALRAEIKAGAVAIAKNTGKTAKILTDFDFDGMPAERTTT